MWQKYKKKSGLQINFTHKRKNIVSIIFDKDFGDLICETDKFSILDAV